MLSEKEIFRHALWGAVFGLICGLVLTYGNEYRNYEHRGIYDIIDTHFYSIYSKSRGTPAERVEYKKYQFRSNLLPKPFPRPVQFALYFLFPGISVAFALGIIHKSLKKFFYAFLGALLGGGIYFFIAKLFKHFMPIGEVLFCAPLIIPLIYSITISLFMGLCYKSVSIAFKAFVGGAVVWAVTTPVVFVIFVFAGVAGWAGDDYFYVPVMIFIHFLTTLFLTAGISIAIEVAQKKCCAE